jgi:hypothetical protein
MKATASLILLILVISPALGQDADAELRKVLELSKGDASRVRGLPFLMDVPVKKMSPADFQVQMMRDMKRAFGEGDQLAHMEKLLQVLRVLPEGMTIEALTRDFFPETVAANYDTVDKKISFLKTYKNPATMRAVMVHELTHALQDQHFNLNHLVLSSELTFDRLLALGALVEGDAKNTEMSFSAGPFLKGMTLEAIQQFGNMQAQNYLRRMKDFPRGIARPFIFQYLDGLVFVEAVKRDGDGFSSIDLAYRDPPQTTEQILHPERYLERDHPTVIVPPDMPAGYEVLVENTLGELGVSIVLSGHLGKAYQASMAAGWDGDRILLLGSEGAEPMLVWYSTWDTKEDAHEFGLAAAQMLRLRHPEADETHSKATLDLVFLKDKMAASVRQIEKDVLLMERVPEERLKEISLALHKASKEELRVHREPFQSGK